METSQSSQQSSYEPIAHDRVGPGQTTFEAASIVTATGLLFYHGRQLAVHAPETLWPVIPIVVFGALCADLGSGIVHWIADTWGRETMPVLGRRLLRPFRVHHLNPRDFLRRNFVNTNGDVAFIVAGLLVAVGLLPLGSMLGYWFAVFAVSFAAVSLPTNQVHQWAHMPRPPAFVALLQRYGIILRRRSHALHHAAPHTRNYCIATGWMNRFTVRLRVFERLESGVTAVTGWQPRGDYDDFTREHLEVPHERR